ncbi:MAG: glycosyltransferase family 4 protein [Rothia sp. (in: high G+C Gram-positive bacteria)]|nr:glycosyltransferase family 4 protein [Rothia sp. (in: high G+C Gram-positive bacteria)]
MGKKVYIATNNGDMGGGEVMLLHLARALRSLGKSVTIIGPAQPAELLEAAADEGFSTLVLPAQDRKSYMAQLRLWRGRNRKELLWCNGLVPSLATAGLGPRIVHLHQLPTGGQKLAAKIARRGALLTLVPSAFMAERVAGSTVLENWVPEVAKPLQSTTQDRSTLAVGFLGRVSEIKGTDLLADAIYQLNQQQKDIHFKLLIGGEARFVKEGAQNRVEEALARLGDDLVTLGWVEPEDFFAQVDCLAMPSQWDEPFGLVAAEAMSAKVPLLVTNSGALPSIVGEGYPWLAQRGSSQSIADTLMDISSHLLTSSETLEEVVSRNYWRWYENYSPESGKARVSQIIDNVEGLNK